MPVDECPEPEEQPMLVDQSQIAKARVEEQTASEELVVHTTHEVVPEPKVWIKAELA